MIKNLKRQLLPIIFGTAIVSSVLYIYNAKAIIIITALSFLAQGLLFSFYNVVKEKGRLGTVLYISTVVVLTLVIYTLIMLSGQTVNFVEWFFGIQSDATFVWVYNVSCFIATNFFISSFIFYFTQVIYRSSFMFLVMIIPFALYAKRYENISDIYTVLIMALYIAVMIHCRQMTRAGTVKIITDTSYIKSVSLFVIVTIGIAMLIPKPLITPLRSSFENILSNAGLEVTSSDRLSGFSDFSGGAGTSTNKILFRVNASEPLYLRRQTFDEYNGDKWTYNEDYSNSGYAGWSDDCSKLDYNKYIAAIKSAANINTDFSEKYDISSLKNPSDNRLAAEIKTANFSVRYFLNTVNIINITGTDSNPKIYSTLNGSLFIGDSAYLNPDITYTISYYSETVNKDNGAVEFAQNFDKDKYEEMLTELQNIFNNSMDTDSEENADIISEYQRKETEAYKYYEDTYQKPSENIRILAEYITKGQSSDFDKARELAQYFSKNGYTYDLNYKPEQGNENSEYFIFESKRGSCSNYATAMTLMARAIGLPARYVEGFLMNEKEDDGAYIIRDSDAHAFTEVFISGYGWMTFDATVSSDSSDNNSAGVKKLNAESLKIIVIVIILSVLLVVVLIILFPIIKEFGFRIKFKLKKNNFAIIYLYKHIKMRMGKKLRFETDYMTAGMLEYVICNSYGINIHDIITAFEKSCYGRKILSNDELKLAYNTYLIYYKASKKKVNL